MGFGVSIELAPGARVRGSSRSIRANVGPRAACVHVGAGRTSLLSGICPATSSISTGARRRPTSGKEGGGTSPPRTTLAVLEPQVRQAQRETEIAAVARTEDALASLHHEQFRAVLPPPVDLGLTEQTEATRQEGKTRRLERADCARAWRGQRSAFRTRSRRRHQPALTTVDLTG